MKYVLTFGHPDATNAATSGGKGANLAKLTQAGFPVPPGFVISPEAYRDATRSSTPMAGALRAVRHDDHDAVLRASAMMQAMVRAVAMPDELVAEIASLCADTSPDTR